MLGSATGPGGGPQRGLWPLAPAPASASFMADSLSKYGVYSLFPPTLGGALYSHASTIGRFGHIQQSSSGNTFHTSHKVSDSLFSSGYTFGAPTPPPGSPYSPIPVAQLELLAKGLATAGPVVVQQAPLETAPAPPSPRRACADRCCAPRKGSGGCSRTCPLEWAAVSVKKEPGATPCQVAEVSTSGGVAVKLEATSPTQKAVEVAANIPLGITLTRQRVQQELIASPSTGLLTTVSTGGATIKELDPPGTTAAIQAAAAGMAAGAAVGGPPAPDDRAPPLAGWAAAGGAGATAPAYWQYPAPVSMEPVVPFSVPMPPMGFQLVRDPNSGGLLLLPTTGIEPLQQAVVWPSYQQQPSVLLPSISSMPPPPLQLLSSTSSDFLSSSTTLHQHTQTHSTRLVAVTTDSKRKIPLPIPATTLIKIETDATTLDQTKTMQSVSTIASNTGTVFTDQNMTPLVTTHVIYQHPTNLILSQTPTSAEAACRSQATSPVTCLTPPPEAIQNHEEEQSMVQDASNQTDTPICSEDDNTSQDGLVDDKKLPEAIPERIEEPIEAPMPLVVPEPIEEEEAMEIAAVPQEPEPSSTTCEGEQIQNETVLEPEEPALENEEEPTVEPDLSGLELLSNSIEEFESCRNNNSIIEEDVLPKEDKIEIIEKVLTPTPNLAKEDVPEQIWPKPVEDNSLVGLDLLCALAEQRILEENIDQPVRIEKEKKERRREKRKSKKHSHDEPKRKKMKSDKKHSSESRERKQKRREEKLSNESSEKSKEPTDNASCSCKDNFRKYKTPESEEEAKKFIASKSQSMCCKGGDWPCMNAMELDMRMKLADLQRQYREKQMELSKLKPKKHSHWYECSKKKSRKKSTHSDRSTPPPLLDKMDVPVKPNRDNSDLLKPPTLCAMPKIEDVFKTSSSEDCSPEKHNQTKKRKVGTPKKLMTPAGDVVATETIVAKKPKSNFVGYLLAAKEKLKLQSKIYPNTTPPRYVEDLPKPKKNKNNNIIEEVKSSRIKPKLRAEAMVKCVEEDEEPEEDNEVIDHIEEDIDEEETEAVVEEEAEVQTEAEPDNPCTLTEKHLEMDKLRVLTAMGGLFYAGHLNAVEPPDVYSITLDGERGNRPHIMSREEILRDAIVEVSPKSVDELPYGTRLCAYWSQQYRCLYPGSVAEPGTPDPHLDRKFVSVEFDDGDSGRIALEDIRLLPPNYPIIEYDPNPLLSLCKRRRRTSTSVSTDEPKRQSISSAPLEQTAPKSIEEPKEQKIDIVKVESSTEHKEKKRLKKKKREKLRQKLLKHDTKKKKRKHKCVDENCKHKKHKKHRKHKKHHKTEEAPEVTALEETTVDNVDLATIEEVEEEIEESDDRTSSKQEEEFPEYHIIPNPEDEVTMDDILEATQTNCGGVGYDTLHGCIAKFGTLVLNLKRGEATKKSKKIRDRQESCESRSKMSAFLPARQFWNWSGKGYKRKSAKGRSKKSFYKSIQRGKETITVGDSAVFLSTGRPDRPYIGRIEAMWELCGTMVVKVKWFYHPEETVGCPMNLQYPGALFESPHVDENDVQTISHKCEVLPLKDYTERLGDDPQRYASIYDNNDIYYLAGHYDPTTTTLRMEPDIPFEKGD